MFVETVAKPLQPAQTSSNTGVSTLERGPTGVSSVARLFPRAPTITCIVGATQVSLLISAVSVASASLGALVLLVTSGPTLERSHISAKNVASASQGVPLWPTIGAPTLVRNHMVALSVARGSPTTPTW